MRGSWLLSVLLLAACGGGGGGGGGDGGAGGSSGGGGGGSGGSNGRRVPLRFAPDPHVVTEGDTTSFELVLDEPVGETVTGEIAIDGGDAGAGDHDLMPGPFSIPPGETSVSFQFRILDDLEVEPDEELRVTVPMLENAIGPSAHVITITDDDAPSTTLTVDPPATTTVPEQDVSLAYTLRLSAAVPVDVDVALTVQGTALLGRDHDLDATSVTIPAGQTSLDVPFQVFDDAFDENDETIEVAIDSAPNANLGDPANFTLTIADDDPLPIVNVLEAERVVTEGTAGTLVVRVVLSEPTGRGIDIPYTITGTATETEDYTKDASVHVNPSLSINGASNDLRIVDDDVPEPDETLVITLGTPDNGVLGSASVQTIKIVDDDSPVVTVASPSVNFATASSAVLEGTGATRIPLRLSGRPSGSLTVPFTVSGTASVPADHDLTAGSVVIPAEARDAAIDLTIWSNAVVEGSRDVVVTLGTPTGGALDTPSTHTLTIVDDDGPGILYEETQDNRFGSSLAPLGDLTGDGIPDFAASQGFQGQATVYSGADFSVVLTADGTRVASAGDWDGDSLPDVAVGDSSFDDPSGENVGKVSIFGTGGVLVTELVGPEPSIAFARQLGGGCDIDGDARPEVFVGAEGFDDGDTQDVGALFVYSSATGALQETFVGLGADDALGSAHVGCVGDYDGDGVADLAAGVEHFFRTTWYGAMIFSGVTGNTLFRAVVRNQDFFTLTGLGDVDGDGTDDASIAYVEEDCTLASCQHLDVRTLRTFDVLWNVPAEQPQIDFGVTPGGTTLADFDGDGTADLVTTARGFAGPAGDRTGKLYVFSGVTRELIYAFVGPTIEGFVSRVANVGDLNGDGADELLVGAPGISGFDDGTIYVLSFNP